MGNILIVATGGTRAPTQIDLWERFVKDGHRYQVTVRLMLPDESRECPKLPA